MLNILIDKYSNMEIIFEKKGIIQIETTFSTTYKNRK